MRKNGWKIKIVSLLLLLFLGMPHTTANAAVPKLSAKKLEIPVGTDAKLKVSRAGKKTIQWKTSNSRIVSVKKLTRTSAKLMAGSKKGSANVKVKVGKKTLKCKVKVVDWHFTATNGTTIPVGGSTTFKFQKVSAKSFSSSDPKVAKVSKKGKITGLKAGSCYIYFKVGRIRYKTGIKVVKKQSSGNNQSSGNSQYPNKNRYPSMTLGTYFVQSGKGDTSYISTKAEVGETGVLNISNSARGVLHYLHMYVNGKYLSSGMTFKSSKPKVLSYFRMIGTSAVFYSYQDGTTDLTIGYGGYTYKFRVTISDRDSAQFLQKRDAIYRSLGISSAMAPQYVCCLLARWICDNASYDYSHKDENGEASGISGINATYKDYFRYRAVVCSGYADLFMYLCAGLGIPCRQVDYSNEAHRWNQVQINGKWYNVDCTWMDPDSGMDGKYKFQYFLVSDAAMCSMGSHLTDPSFPCTDKRFDGCTSEQIAKQKENGLDSRTIFPHYSELNPWMTGTWAYY